MSDRPTFRSWRWLICGWLFFSVLINFLDRITFSLATPVIVREFRLTNGEIATIAASFAAAYYPGMILWGRLVDLLGSRRGLSVAVIWWSIAEALTARARTVLGFGTYRFLLGFGESAVGPGCLKVVSEWFGVKERATAVGLYTAGSTMAGLCAPIITFLIVRVGWDWAFIAAGALGILWVLAWLAAYRPLSIHPYVSTEERELIKADMPGAEADLRPNAGRHGGMRWGALFRHRQVWGLLLARVFCDPLSIVLVTFFPKYLVEQRNFTMITMGVVMMFPTIFGTLGLISGGVLAGYFIRRGMCLGRARKTLLVLGLLLLTMVVPAVLNPSKVILLLLYSLASLGSGIYSANVNALPVDMAPRHLVASLLGVSASGGGLASVIIVKVAGAFADRVKSLGPVFVAAGLLPVLSMVTIIFFLGRIQMLPDEAFARQTGEEGQGRDVLRSAAGGKARS
jgi:ACS family hexuronate transporter-like MFS transporter